MRPSRIGDRDAIKGGLSQAIKPRASRKAWSRACVPGVCSCQCLCGAGLVGLRRTEIPLAVDVASHGAAVCAGEYWSAGVLRASYIDRLERRLVAERHVVKMVHLRCRWLRHWLFFLADLLFRGRGAGAGRSRRGPLSSVARAGPIVVAARRGLGVVVMGVVRCRGVCAGGGVVWAALVACRLVGGGCPTWGGAFAVSRVHLRRL